MKILKITFIRFCCRKRYKYICSKRQEYVFHCFCNGKCNYRTFPGKDRETEWDLRPIILAVLDPGGNLLSKDDMQVYIKSNVIVPYSSNK